MKPIMKNPALLILLIIFSSCVKQYGELDNPKSLEDDYSDFDMKTVTLENISVQLKTEDEQPLSGVLFKLWTDAPANGGEVIMKGITDQNGYFSAEYNLPTSIDQLILETKYIGLADYLIIPRQDIVNGIEIAGMTHDYEVLDESLIPNRSIDNGANAAPNGRTMANYATLGSYDKNGVPDYLEKKKDKISKELLSFINASLPEGYPVPTYHPKYIAESAQSNIVVTEQADIWMTFVHEGAGYRNILGFYTYPTDNPPSSVNDIETIHIAFPNASFKNSGGGLRSGHKVHLGEFEAGTTIGFVLMANGWNGSITGGLHQVYSNHEFNPESTPEKRRHSVLLWDESNELFLVGFEDLNRDTGSDDDFNDAVFYISANPIQAINTSNVNPIDKPEDADGDGVNNVYDEFPDDARYAYSYKYPGENTYGTFAFEDQWPRVGDYDFNDLVVDYQYNQFANATNQMVKLQSKYVVKAVGASFSNGFGVQLDLSPSAISSVTGNDVRGNMYTFNSNGTEAGQSKAVVIVSDNVHQGFGPNGFINTSTNLDYQTPDTINVDIEFANALSLSGAGSAPFNPFMIINGSRGREVHLPGYSPTDLVDATLFGEENDNSDPEQEIYYKSKTGLPWAMNLPTSFAYPIEKIDVRTGYSHFDTWAKSSGFSYMDWYQNKPNYRNDSKLYIR